MTGMVSCNNATLNCCPVVKNKLGFSIIKRERKENLYLPSAVFVAQVLVGPSKQLKQIFQIEHNIVKNPGSGQSAGLKCCLISYFGQLLGFSVFVLKITV